MTESFKCAAASDWLLFGNASLTGDGSPDPVCNGWLRLTSTGTYQAGSAVYDVAIPNADGFVATFQYADYGGTGADGFSFYLIDGATLTPTIGGEGGALGYTSAGSSVEGVTNGYVGVGFDEHGNFSSPGVGSGGPGTNANQVALRGSGNLLTGFNYLTAFQLDGMSPARSIDGVTRANARWTRVFVVDNKISVQMDFGAGWQTLIDAYDLAGATGQSALPATFKLGFSGATGGSTNYHEIRNLTLAKATTLDVDEISDRTMAAPGDSVVFTATITNDAMNDVPGATVLAPIPTRLNDVTWTCTASSGSACTASGTGGISDTVSLLKNGTLTYTIQGVVNKLPGGLVHTTEIVPPPAFSNLDNGTDGATVTVQPELLVSGTATFVGTRAPVVIAPELVITAGTQLTLTGARAVVLDNFETVNDRLGISGTTGTSGNIGAIVWNYNTTTGIMTLNGTDTITNYQAALRSVTYAHLTAPTVITTRTVEFGLGTSLPFLSNGHFYERISTVGTWDTSLAAAEARTYFGLQGYLATVTSDAERQFVGDKVSDGAVWLGASGFPADSDPIEFRWVTGPEGLENGGAGRTFWELACGTGVRGICAATGEYNYWENNEPSLGNTPLRVWMGYLGPEYWDDTPKTNTASVNGGYVVEYGGMPGDPPLAIHGYVQVSLEPDSMPELSVTDEATFTGNHAPILVAPTLVITDANGPAETLTAARVFIGDNFDATNDRLGISGQSGTSGSIGAIDWNYNTTNGVMTLNGTDTIAGYQAALRAVTYKNLINPTSATTRTVNFVLGNAMSFEGTGHFYEYVVGSISWSSARNGAMARSYFGQQGYLATITSAAENAFANDKLGGGAAWLGGSDVNSESNWTWMTGPEAGTVFCRGNDPCTPQSGAYTNWNSGEPNDSDGEDYLQFLSGGSGKWNDQDDNQPGYVVEYGGLAGDPVLTITGASLVDVIPDTPPELAVAGEVTFTAGYTPVVVAPELVITDTDSPADSLSAARVLIGTNFNAVNDRLGISGQSGTGGSIGTLSWNYNTTSGVLLLSGTASITYYQEALRTVTYYNLNFPTTMTTRTIEFMLGNALAFPDNGHFYELVSTVGTWDASRTAAAARAYFGQQGYLATITSEAERRFVGDKVADARAWLGGSGYPAESAPTEYRWVTGPEGLENSGGGRTFWVPACGRGIQGTCNASGQYNYWAGGEPNATGGGARVWMGYQVAEYWDDTLKTDTTSVNGGYVVEYGGMAGDPVLHITGQVTVNVAANADLALTKTSEDLNGEPLYPGDILRYTLYATNTGPLTHTAVYIEDLLPAGLDFVSAAPTDYIESDPPTWYWDSFAPGATWVGVILARVNGTTTPLAGNVARIRSDQQGWQGTEPILPPGSPDLAPGLVITKSSDDLNGTPLYTGDILRYTIRVTNTGTAMMTGVIVTDTLPAGVVFDSATPGDYTGPNPLIWNVGDLDAGAAWTGEILVHVDGSATPIGGNVAQVGSNEQGPQSTAPILPPGSPDLAPGLVIAKTAEDLNGTPLYTGDILRYTIRVTNTGTSMMTGVIVTDTLPAGVVFDSATPGDYTGPNPLIWNVGDLDADAVWTGEILVHIDGSATPIGGNVAQVGSNEQGPQGTAPILPPGSPDLAPGLVIAKTAEDLDGTPLYTGDTLLYTIRVTNTGTTTMTGLIVTDTLPAGINFGAASPSGYTGPNPLVWNLASLEAGQTWTALISVTIIPSATTIGGNIAQLSSNEQGPQSTGPILPSEGSTVVTNTAPLAHDDSYDVPEGEGSPLAVLENDSDRENDPLTVVQVGTPQHGVAMFTSTGVIYTPTAGYLGTDTFTYTVSDGLLQTTAQVSTTVAPVADLEINQLIQATTAGYKITIVARNLGPRPAPGTMISDTFPANFAGIAWTCVGAGGATCADSGSGSVLSETLSSFPAGGVITYTITADEAVSVIAHNTVTITPPGTIFDLNLENNQITRPTIFRMIFPLIYKNSGITK